MGTLIKKYIDIVSENTDAPMNSITASAYWLISSTLGYWINLMDTPAEHGTRCNLFVLIIGQAGITRKSTVMGYASYVYRTAWREFYQKVGIDIDIDDKFIEEFTVEGIADQVQSAIDSGIDDFVLMTDEFGIWLARAGATHLLGSKGLLSKLYYGKGYKQSLSQRGGKKGTREIPEGLYWTFLGAMQDPELYLTEIDVKQGFLRRFLLVSSTDDDLREYKPPLSYERRFLKDKLSQIAKELCKKMLDIYNFVGGFLPLDTYCSKSVESAINEYDIKTYNEVRNIYTPGSVISRYMVTSWEHILKLTALTAISDQDKRPIMLAGNPSFYLDNTEHFIIARDWFDVVKQRIFSAIETISVNMQNPTLPSMDNVANRIIGAINRAGGSVTTGELLRSLGTTKQHIKPYLTTLVEQGKVVPVYEITSKGIIRLFLDNNKAKEYVNNQLTINPKTVIRILDVNSFDSMWK